MWYANYFHDNVNSSFFAYIQISALNRNKFDCLFLCTYFVVVGGVRSFYCVCSQFIGLSHFDKKERNEIKTKLCAIFMFGAQLMYSTFYYIDANKRRMSLCESLHYTKWAFIYWLCLVSPTIINLTKWIDATVVFSISLPLSLSMGLCKRHFSMMLKCPLHSRGHCCFIVFPSFAAVYSLISFVNLCQDVYTTTTTTVTSAAQCFSHNLIACLILLFLFIIFHCQQLLTLERKNLLRARQCHYTHTHSSVCLGNQRKCCQQQAYHKCLDNFQHIHHNKRDSCKLSRINTKQHAIGTARAYFNLDGHFFFFFSALLCSSCIVAITTSKYSRLRVCADR